jgi:nitrite reductase/ring-hydroxylating ferredoxin subunit
VRRRPRVAVPDGTTDVAAAAAVPDGPPFLEVRVRGGKLLLVRRPDGSVAAFPAGCPHLGTSLRRAALDAEALTCRKHGYRYRLTDGACLWPGGPHDDALEVYETGEVDGRVWVRLPGRRG